MHGWQREPAEDVLDDWLTNWWQVDTSRYVYRRDLPADVDANFSLSGTASVTRDLRPADASAVSQWSLAGKIAWGNNQNRREYGQAHSTGHYLEVLDSAGRIIARMYPNLFSYPNIRIYGNSASLRQLDVTDWGLTILDTPIPFEISAENAQITFTHGTSTSAPVAVFDPASDWRNPTTLRLFFFQSGVSYPQTVGLTELIFAASP